MENKLKEFLADFFDTTINAINENFSQNTFEDWDSMTHLRLITALEKEFNVKLTMTEIQEGTSLKSLLNTLKVKGG
jgi:acyl carrier protein